MDKQKIKAFAAVIIWMMVMTGATVGLAMSPGAPLLSYLGVIVGAAWLLAVPAMLCFIASILCQKAENEVAEHARMERIIRER